MRPGVWLLLIATTVLPLLAEENGGRAEYIGGTAANLSARMEGVLVTNGPDYFIFRAKGTDVRIPYEKINLVEYGQKVDRRYVEAILLSPMFLLSKKRKHFLTVGFTDESGEQQAVVFRVKKSDIRSILVSLEARSGRKVTYQDEEARKAGKG